MSSNSYNASILSFPMEILLEISKHTPLRSPLRLVCKKFNVAFTPQMFSCLHIAFRDDKQGQFLEVLESLAIKSHPAILHARSLKIGQLSPPKQPVYTHSEEENKKLYLEHRLKVLNPYNAHLALIKKWLPLGLSNLCKISSATWMVRYYQEAHDWSQEIISRISCLSSLTTFRLIANFDDDRYARLSTLRPLHELTIHTGYRTSVSVTGSIQGLQRLIERSSDQLRRLEIEGVSFFMGRGKTPLLLHVFHEAHDLPLLTSLSLIGIDVILDKKDLHKLRSLEVLCVKRVPKHSPWHGSNGSYHSSLTGNLWILLKETQISLNEITIDEPNESFFCYLRSYTGLKTLVITSALYDTPEESDEFALNFYQSDVLMSHSKSLQKLVVTPKYEGKWCFGEHCSKIFSTFFNLRHLSVSIVTDPPSSAFRPDMNPVMRHVKYEYQYDMLHPVCQMLKKATSLPNLELLSMNAASSSSNRGKMKRCLHTISGKRQIYKNVTSYAPLDPTDYRFTVELSGIYLKARRNTLGEYKYEKI